MNPTSFVKILVLLAACGYLAAGDAEARVVAAPQNNISPEELNAMAHYIERAAGNEREQADNDDDDDDDDRSNLQLQNPLLATATGPAASLYYNSGSGSPILAEQTNGLPSRDLKTSASHHHHGHGVKGWLDMGAWTGKKGAFGWHDKHPVGGKGRK